MEINGNHVAAAGGVLGALAGLLAGIAAFLRRVRARGEWKGRMEQAVVGLAEDVGELKADQREFRKEVRTEFASLQTAIMNERG
jgi:Ser/Thr protein kinase RdoA (MazF antagonist)